jgi:hypothetical protein
MQTLRSPQEAALRSLQYFSKAFNSDFEEAKSGVMNLPDDDPLAFPFFIRWLYGGK